MHNFKYLERLGTTLLLFLLLTYSSAVFLFIAGYGLSSLPVLIGIFGAYGYYFYSSWRSKVSFFLTVAGVTGLTVIVLFLCILYLRVYDFSWDGQLYHGFGIYYMTEKHFNPYHQYVIPTEEFWFFYYSKSQEILSAAISYVWGSFEVGKVSTVLFSIVAFLLSSSFLMQLVTKFKRNLPLWLIIALSYFAAFNPVVFAQMFTNYVDAQQFLLVYIIVLLCVKHILFDISSSSLLNCKTYLLVFCSIVYAINLKFGTGLWLLIFLFGILANCYYQKIKINYILVLVGATAFLLGVLVFGYNPYVLNFIYHGHMFYPINVVDVVKNQAPGYFLVHNRFVNFLVSTLAPVNNFVGGAQDIGSIINLHAYKFYTRYNTVPDNRINGVGPFFCIAFYMALFAFVLRGINFKQNNLQNIVVFKKFAGIVAVIFIALFATPYAWWFRHVPFYYMIPILWIIYDSQAKDKLSLICKVIILSSLILNNVRVIYPEIRAQIAFTKQEKLFFTSQNQQYIFSFKNTNHPIPGELVLNLALFSQRLNDWGVSYTIDNNLYCDPATTSKTFMNVGCYKILK